MNRFGTAADYHWLVRVLSWNNSGVFYYPQRTLTMRVGGASGETIAARLRANAMDGKVWADHSLTQSLVVRFCKPIRKGRTRFVPSLSVRSRREPAGFDIGPVRVSSKDKQALT